jgi:hypothetical protein
MYPQCAQAAQGLVSWGPPPHHQSRPHLHRPHHPRLQRQPLLLHNSTPRSNRAQHLDAGAPVDVRVSGTSLYFVSGTSLYCCTSLYHALAYTIPKPKPSQTMR